MFVNRSRSRKNRLHVARVSETPYVNIICAASSSGIAHTHERDAICPREERRTDRTELSADGAYGLDGHHADAWVDLTGHARL
jgi:hypothetical protein